MRAAGFVEVNVELAPYNLEFRERDDWLAWLRSMEFADYLELLSSGELAHLSASASAEFAAKDTGLAVVMPMDGLVTRARRP